MILGMISVGSVTARDTKSLDDCAAARYFNPAALQGTLAVDLV